MGQREGSICIYLGSKSSTLHKIKEIENKFKEQTGRKVSRSKLLRTLLQMNHNSNQIENIMDTLSGKQVQLALKNCQKNEKAQIGIQECQKVMTFCILQVDIKHYSNIIQYISKQM